MGKKQHSVANKYSTPEEKKKKPCKEKKHQSQKCTTPCRKKLPKIAKNPLRKKKQHFTKKCEQKACGKTKVEHLQKKKCKTKQDPLQKKN